MSHVTCHVLPVLCHLLFIHFPPLKTIGQSGGASRRRVCYQRGLSRLVLKHFHALMVEARKLKVCHIITSLYNTLNKMAPTLKFHSWFKSFDYVKLGLAKGLTQIWLPR